MKEHLPKWVLVGVALAAPAALVALALLFSSSTTTLAANSIIRADIVGDVGQWTSMALDSNGRPVVSYWDATRNQLKVLHCGDVNCWDSTSTYPDPSSNVGQYTSLALDSNGRPVVSYYDASAHALKVLHCGDANCSAGNSITSPDTNYAGAFTSLALDSVGRPVVSYQGYGALMVLHCGNANCTAGNSITSPDMSGQDVGRWTSLALDGSGNPVISYYDATAQKLKVMHCNDAYCAGNNESIAVPEAYGNVGEWTSLVLDASGNPVVSYWYRTDDELKVLHCGNPNCTAGNSITSPDKVGSVGWWTSLALDSVGRPVVGYHDGTNGDLKVLHCGNVNCTAGNAITSPDTAYDVGYYISLVLDSSSRPVVSYWDMTSWDLKVLHCGDTWCFPGNSITYPDSFGGEWTSLALDASGNPVVSYRYSWSLEILHCDDPNCAAGGDSNIEIEGHLPGFGAYSSLQLDPSGNPDISLGNEYDGTLYFVHCSDPNCTSYTSRAPEIDPTVLYTSLALDGNGHAVIAYQKHTGTNTGQLRVIHCINDDCSSNYKNAVDWQDDSGAYPSLALDTSGNPVISYDRWSTSEYGDLYVAHCNDVNCAGSATLSPVDVGPGDAGRWTSLALDASGKPVVSYYSFTANALRVVHCSDTNCTGRILVTIGSGGGSGTSLALGSGDWPVVSYEGDGGVGLTLLRCGNPNCEVANIITIVDGGDGHRVGASSSLELDSNGNPVISYYDVTGDALRLAHCGSPSCGPGPVLPPFPPGDSDGDGCADTEEAAGAPPPKPGSTGAYDPLDPYDFYDVPVGALKIDPTGVRDQAVTMGDVLAILAYVGDTPAKSAYNTDLNGNTVKDGLEYDRSPSAEPNPPWDAGPPDAAVTMSDVLAALAQVGLSCAGPP